MRFIQADMRPSPTKLVGVVKRKVRLSDVRLARLFGPSQIQPHPDHRTSFSVSEKERERAMARTLKTRHA